VIRTTYGVFDTIPLPGQTVIPRNLGNSPGKFTINLRLSKSFGFGRNPQEAGMRIPGPCTVPPWLAGRAVGTADTGVAMNLRADPAVRAAVNLLLSPFPHGIRSTP
jgi:hypothetical protein